MSPFAPIIRQAVESDAAELARLTTQLGYPVSEESMQARLAPIIARPDHRLLVAETPGRGLAGWIHAFRSHLMESDSRVEIGGLVVDERWRRSGIGRKLVQSI